ncbi:MAG: hypothetical protein MJ090_00060 [Clostridia bacterium]|nr:hypothetical protein [Clostridia bacterium]
MELKIDDLVSSIKKDGIDAANAEAEKIIANAKMKASKIIEEAKEEQEKIKQQTKADIEVLRESAKVGAMQAERDAVILFEDSIKKRFEKILEADIAKTVNGDALVTLIKAAISDENPADYSVEISEVQEGLKGELAEQIKNGLEIKISSSVKTGFRLSAKDGSGYFDCSDEEITNMLTPFLPEIKF